MKSLWAIKDRDSNSLNKQIIISFTTGHCARVKAKTTINVRSWFHLMTAKWRLLLPWKKRLIINFSNFRWSRFKNSRKNPEEPRKVIYKIAKRKVKTNYSRVSAYPWSLNWLKKETLLAWIVGRRFPLFGSSKIEFSNYLGSGPISYKIWNQLNEFKRGITFSKFEKKTAINVNTW